MFGTCFSGVMPLNHDIVFNGITTGRDYLVPYDAGIYISPSLARIRREALAHAYPNKQPLEKTKGWKHLTEGYLGHDMARDFELRRLHWEEAQRIYFSQLMGDVRLIADWEMEAADGFLRRELIPILLLRPEKVTSINRRPAADFLHSMGWAGGEAALPVNEADAGNVIELRNYRAAVTA